MKKSAKKKKYSVSIVTSLSKFIGDFEAASEEEAIAKAAESPAYQGIGGICHQCAENVGDMGDGELVAEEEK